MVSLLDVDAGNAAGPAGHATQGEQMHNTEGNEVARPPDTNAVTSASGANSEDVADMAARTLVDSREGGRPTTRPLMMRTCDGAAADHEGLQGGHDLSMHY